MVFQVNLIDLKSYSTTFYLSIIRKHVRLTREVSLTYELRGTTAYIVYTSVNSVQFIPEYMLYNLHLQTVHKHVILNAENIQCKYKLI